MPRKRNAVPSYLEHKPSGQAVMYVHANGKRVPIYLGKYNSPESHKEYDRIRAELRVVSATTAAAVEKVRRCRGLTVAEIVLAFLNHAETYYLAPDGKPREEVKKFATSVRQLVALYSHTLADELGPLALKAVRQSMIDEKLCRGVINQRIRRVIAVFRWASSEELVSADVWHKLKAVEPLKIGHTSAKDHPEVEPVSDDAYRRTLPYCSPAVAAMLKLIRLAGARPAELCRMRLIDIDMSENIWEYRLAAHKTAHRGKKRIIYFGPQAQMILKPFLAAIEPADFVFSPIRERAKRYQEKRANRKTPVQPSQEDRSKARPKRQPGDYYKPHSIVHAVRVAIEKANARAAEVAGRKLKPTEIIPNWFPYQLRHAHGTEVRKHFGLEHAQVALGHARADVTQIYAQRDRAKAIEVAKMVG